MKREDAGPTPTQTDHLASIAKMDSALTPMQMGIQKHGLRLKSMSTLQPAALLRSMTTGQIHGAQMEIRAGKMQTEQEVHTMLKLDVARRSIQTGGKILGAKMDQGLTQTLTVKPTVGVQLNTTLKQAATHRYIQTDPQRGVTMELLFGPMSSEILVPIPTTKSWVVAQKYSMMGLSRHGVRMGQELGLILREMSRLGPLQ